MSEKPIFGNLGKTKRALNLIASKKAFKPKLTSLLPTSNNVFFFTVTDLK